MASDSAGGTRSIVYPDRVWSAGSAVTFAEARFKLESAFRADMRLEVLVGSASMELPFVFEEQRGEML